MNYLAHAHLSFKNPDILVGNMISDFVKGKKKFDFPESIQHGITLHRLIDEFTDNHPATAMAKEFFRPDYRLYSGAIVDVIYDHFLANDKNEFTETSLAAFTQWVYNSLQGNFAVLPDSFQKILPHMQLYDWLFNYIHIWGMERSLAGLVRRSKYLTDHMRAFSIFNSNYGQLKECYDLFYKDVKAFAAAQLTQGGGEPRPYIHQ